MTPKDINNILEKWDEITLGNLLKELEISISDIKRYGIKIMELDNAWSLRCPFCRNLVDRRRYIRHPMKCDSPVCNAWIGAYVNIQERKYCFFAILASPHRLFDIILKGIKP